MSSTTTSRSWPKIAATAILGWFVLVLVVWAIRPLYDSVPLGTDYSGKAPVAASVEVKCNTLFESAPLSSPLSPLKVQPADKPPLAYQHVPCEAVHGEARIVLALNAFFAAVTLAVSGWFWRRQRDRDAHPPASTPDLAEVKI